MNASLFKFSSEMSVQHKKRSVFTTEAAYSATVSKGGYETYETLHIVYAEIQFLTEKKNYSVAFKN